MLRVEDRSALERITALEAENEALRVHCTIAENFAREIATEFISTRIRAEREHERLQRYAKTIEWVTRVLAQVRRP